MENKQTAVDWLEDELAKKLKYIIENKHYVLMEILFNHAKQIEKEQIKDAFVGCWKSNIPDGIECKLDAEKYYNETYGKE